MIDGSSIAGPGFVNVVLSRQWIAKVIFNEHTLVGYSLRCILVNLTKIGAEHSKHANRWH